MMKNSNRFKRWIREKFGIPDEEPLPDAVRKWRICWEHLSKNENAIGLLSENQALIDWESLSGNPGATELLFANKDNIHIHRLVSNPHPLAIRLLSENPECIRDWDALLRNPAAASIWRQHADLAMLDGYYIPTHYLTSELPPPWYNLGYADPRDKFIDLLTSKLDAGGFNRRYKVFNNNKRANDHDWTTSMANRVSNRQLVELMFNPNPKLLTFLEKMDEDSIFWDALSTNPIAIDFLEKNGRRNVDSNTIWANPAIFEREYDYDGMRRTPRVAEAELLAVVMHPDRADAYLAAGGTLQEFGELYGRH